MKRESPGTAKPREEAGGLPRAYEENFRFHLPDILRLLALSAIALAGFGYGMLEALTMFLVSGGTWALRYYSQTRWRDALGQLVLLLAGAFSVFGTYKIVGWLDLTVHFLVLLVLSRLLHEMLVHHRMFPRNPEPRIAGGIALSLTGLGALIAVLWEIGEWIGYALISREVGVGYFDTMGDLLTGILGAGMAAALIYREYRVSR